jgi:Glu-tRNA(Gln) amidotransferase subunit E-like FAD-binding protein
MMMTDKQITKEELIKKLKELAKDNDYEMAHIKADNLLLLYLNDEEIEEAYDSVGKWYA